MTGKALVARGDARETEQQVAITAPDGADAGTVFMLQLDTRWRLCKALVLSGLIPQKSPEAAMAVMLKGFELGIPPMQAFASIHYFDGKLAMEAALVDALAVQRLGVRKKILEWTDEVCRIEYTRPGWDPVVAEFTIEEARRAGLLAKKNWKTYPRDMLAARAKARGLRMIAPDNFAGMLAVEETSGPRLSGPGSHEPSALAARLEAHKREAAAAAAGTDRAEEHDDGAPKFEVPSSQPTEDRAPDDGRTALNRRYFAVLNDSAPGLAESPVMRKLWQEQRIGIASSKDWSTEDFELAILLLQRGQVDVKFPEATA